MARRSPPPRCLPDLSPYAKCVISCGHRQPARFSGGATSLRGFADAILRGLRLEPVALAGHCLDELRRAPVVAELHSQLADVTVDNVALDLELAAPDARQELLAAQHRARVCREQVEQRLLDRGERKVLIADTDPH